MRAVWRVALGAHALQVVTCRPRLNNTPKRAWCQYLAGALVPRGCSFVF